MKADAPPGAPLRPRNGQGFALIATLAIVALITILTMGLLGLSQSNLRRSVQYKAGEEARANARLSLMVAIAELQKEMGPDMRVSAQSALFDQNPDTEAVEGVSQPNWLASYDSWGDWLNAPYKNPTNGETLVIKDTYTPGREKMFRKWLLSMPENQTRDVRAPLTPSGWDDRDSVVLVGEGSLGETVQTNPEQVTRAYLNPIGPNGRGAWWISPENHKARINMAKRPRSLTNDRWETSHGDTAEVGTGILSGLGTLDTDSSIVTRMITRESLGTAGVDARLARKHFNNLTEFSQGVLASVRAGHLKKDLSLLFEQPKSSLPDTYRLDPDDIREPSIRPMSPEIANRAVLKERHFASWTRMLHFYRMYRQDSDADAPDWSLRGTEGSPGLNWDGSKPWSDCNLSLYFSPSEGKDTFTRFPVLTNITYILSLKTEPITTGANAGKYDLRYVASPVCVYWNPYNVELRVPDKKLAMRSYLAQVHNMDGLLYLGSAFNREVVLRFDDDYARMMSGDGNDIIFTPGEFRIFSPLASSLVTGNKLDMMPGFDPQSYGGLYAQLGAFTPAQDPRFKIRFSHKINSWKFNFRYGNTPASLVFLEYWSPIGDNNGGTYTNPPFHTHVDWLNTSQTYTFITPPNNPDPWVFDGQLLPVGYFQLALKGIHDHDYPSINWERDWRCRNWIQAPPFYLGKGLYMSEDETIGHTQRIDSPYELRFGPLLGAGKDVDDIIQHVGRSALLGKGEKITAAPALELPSAPIASLAGFATMPINPGWVAIANLNPAWIRGTAPAPSNDSTGNSLYRAESKAWAYQSGITGPGIGNSFLHPIIPRTDVYRKLDNSISMEMKDFTNLGAGYSATDTKAYCDYWDHVLLLNDALWDDYFVSSLADQTRSGQNLGDSLAANLQKLVDGKELSNARYIRHFGATSGDKVKAELEAAEGYLKVAKHLMVDGMFNVNSTSVDAWHALFAGIRERKVVYRDKNGILRTVEIPSGKRIALSRFNTETTNVETTDPEFGITRDDGMLAWSGVRYLDDAQLRKLAEECVKQVKRRGPFLNFSEFINRRLSDDDLGTMGALQSAIDYDDASPDPSSINYNFKSHPDYMLKESDLGDHAFATPQAAVGSRFAGIPGYVIQSDLLKPVANTLAVRDDTFRIRSYGDTRDKNGKLVARVWCEAIVQRVPEYCDAANNPEIPAREITPAGEFSGLEDSALTPVNRHFGRKFRVVSMRWLDASEI